jgi:hypothetical protein
MTLITTHGREGRESSNTYAHSWANNCAKVETPVENGEGSSSLMKEEEVNENTRTKHASNGSEASTEETRDYKPIEIIRMAHERRPDLTQ